MECTVDIVKSGNIVSAMLPFDAREAFQIPRGSIYAQCEIGGTAFQAKLIARGNNRHCILFNRALLKRLGIEGEARGVLLRIEPRAAGEAPPGEAPAVLENETLGVIAARRSIRAFTGGPVGDDALETILRAGFNAPSASAKRPLHFMVSRDRAKLLWLMERGPYAKMLKNAAFCIAVGGDRVIQGMPEWLLADCGAATQNMLLAITSLGLGGCWCGVRQGTDFYKAIEEAFSLPGHIRPMALLAVGVPAEEKAPNDLYDAARVHREVW
ncbi:MAG: nitroreductase family protein [Eubacteriales bacterium]|nr:nitroreductase family protein [Eubacteriales bacterium]